MAELKPDAAKLTRQLKFHGAWPMAVAFLGSGDRLAAGNREGQILVWDLSRPAEDSEAGEGEPQKTDEGKAPDLPPLRSLEGHTNAVSRLVTADEGRTLISASLDHTIRFWDTSAPAEGSTRVVVDAEPRRGGRQPAEDAANAGVEVETQTSSHVLTAHEGWVTALAVSRDGRRLVSGDDKPLCIVWDLAARSEISRRVGYLGNWVASAALSPDGQTAFACEFCASRGSFDRPPAQVKLWDAESGEETLDVLVVQFPDVKNRDNSYGYAQTWGKFVKRGLVAADFSPDGKLLAVGQGGETDTGKVHLLDAVTGEIVRTVSGHQYGVTDVRFSDDGRYLLSCGRDTTVRVCQVEDGKEVAQLGKPRGGQFKDWFSSLALSSDGRRIAAADTSGLVHVWTLE